jgi:hypothetical protein
MNRNDQIFVVRLFGSCFAVMAAYILARYADSQTAAGWVQAVGTLLALIIAIAVPYQTAEAERDRIRKARAERAELLNIILVGDVKTLRDEAALLAQPIATLLHATLVPSWSKLKLSLSKRLEEAAFDPGADPMVLRPIINILLVVNAHNAFVDMMNRTVLQPGALTTVLNEIEKRRRVVEKLCNEHMVRVSKSQKGNPF